MAITGTDQRIDEALRDSLQTDMTSRSDGFSSAVGGGAGSIGHMFSSLVGSVSGKAGITADMVEKIRSSYDSYIETINSDIAQIENPAINQAFKGSSIESAFKNLVTQVKATAQEFTKTLYEAEMSIIQGVQTVYQSQDTAVGGDINADTGTLN